MLGQPNLYGRESSLGTRPQLFCAAPAVAALLGGEANTTSATIVGVPGRRVRTSAGIVQRSAFDVEHDMTLMPDTTANARRFVAEVINEQLKIAGFAMESRCCCPAPPPDETTKRRAAVS